MSEKVDLFFPLFVSDYLSDTTDLTTEEHGAYLLLLMALWKRQGSLPVDPQRLARIAGVPQGRWEAVWSTIGRFFAVSGDTVTQGRLSVELERAREQRAKAVERGKKGAASRYRQTTDIPPEQAQTEHRASKEQATEEVPEQAWSPPPHLKKESSARDPSEHVPQPPRTPPSKVSGYGLIQLFSRIRGEFFPGGLPWKTAVTSDGKSTSMAEDLNEDPDARADVAETMRRFWGRVRDGTLHKAEEASKNISLAFVAWCSAFHSLREEIHGKTPKVAGKPRAAGSDGKKAGATAEAIAAQQAIVARTFGST